LKFFHKKTNFNKFYSSKLKSIKQLMDNEIKNKLKKIKLLIMDVDGTLTDAAMFYNSQGEFMKRFYTRDGFGIDLMHKAGLKTAIITQEYTDIVMTRAKKIENRQSCDGFDQQSK